jgi:hypothetical protein
VLPVLALIDMHEWGIDDRVPAAFDVGKRRVDDMSSMVAAMPGTMTPVIVLVVVNFDDAGRRLIDCYGNAHGKGVRRRYRRRRKHGRDGHGKRDFG